MMEAFAALINAMVLTIAVAWLGGMVLLIVAVAIILGCMDWWKQRRSEPEVQPQRMGQSKE